MIGEETENIDEMAEKDDHQEKMIFFFKNEADPVLDIDQGSSIDSTIKFQDPLQVQFLVGGEAELSCQKGNKNEVLGLLTYASNQDLWANLISEITERTDSEIRRGCRIDLEFDEMHSFYLNGFSNKEEAIGTIQEKHKSWIKKMQEFIDRSTPETIEKGNEMVEDQGIKEERRQV